MAYYAATGNPGTQTSGRSATIREEFLLIQGGFGQVENDIQALAAAVGIGTATTENDISSSTVCDIGNAQGNVLRITGTNSIASFGTNYTGPKQLRFAAALTLLNNAAMVLPSLANITTSAGDVCIAVPIGNPATGWRVLAYCRMSKPLVDDDAIRKSVATPQVLAGTLQATGFIGNLVGNVSGTATNVTGIIGVTNGGTGATSEEGARTALGLSSVFRQYVLVLNGSNLELRRSGGTLLTVAGLPCTIPSTPLTVAATGIGAAASRTVYVQQTAGVISSIVLSTTASVVSTTGANAGNRVMTGDENYTAVGEIYCKAAATFADSATQRFVRSYDNEQALKFKNFIVGAAVGLVGSASPAQISSSLIAEAWLFPGETIEAGTSGTASISGAGDTVYTGIAFNSLTTPETGAAGSYSVASNVGVSAACCTEKLGLSAGYNYFTALGWRAGAGSPLWAGSSNGQHCMSIYGSIGKAK